MNENQKTIGDFTETHQTVQTDGSKGYPIEKCIDTRLCKIFRVVSDIENKPIMAVCQNCELEVKTFQK